MMTNELQPESDDFSRYSRQIRFGPIGEAGQKKLLESSVLVVGVGALGSVCSEILARSGIGMLRLVDRDYVDLSNLQRQSLFTEIDAKEGIPKAIAAASCLRSINSTIQIDPHVADVTPENISRFAETVDLVIDGTDNFEIRFLINDYCVREHKPWIYTGCVGAEGQTMTIIPGETACLRCLLPAGPPTSTATCDTAGVLAPIIHQMSAVQSMEAIKILSGNASAISRGLQVFSMWDGRNRYVPTGKLLDSKSCPACALHQFEWLEGNRFSRTTRLCGRNSVQITPGDIRLIDLRELANNLQSVGPVTVNSYLLRLAVKGCRMTIFEDGRAIIEGTEDFKVAKSLYSQYFG